ncbi:uroporphyrinogen-III synthase [Nereida sp. MMG025]|uniref:uroporphyrinogen-III synthase n=1 Tax=Nereida sp. MMG025 TaxID=2909981 RepID=UPI001F299961|nr:uroporphyrinogen-III synthase [Nereida sp. MMG025]MCF6444653.1 uroporphyrinogen-III synthase [Nereida sp. MMG025]
MDFLDRLGVQMRVLPPSITSPLLRIAPFGEGRALPKDSIAIFTSRNGIVYGPKGSGQLAYCVGDETAKAATQAGYTAISAQGNAENLLERVLLDRNPNEHVHFSGAQTRGDIVERLVSQGLKARREVVYQQVAERLSRTAQELVFGPEQTLILLFSPMTARNLRDQINKPMPHTQAVCLSDAIAREITDLGIEISVSARPDADALIDRVCQIYTGFPPP